MDPEDSSNPLMESSPSFLSSSSRKKRAAAETLKDCLSYGLPASLRVRVENSIGVLSQDLRSAHEVHANERTPDQIEARRAEKKEALAVLKDCMEASIPNWFKPRVAQSIRDLTGNLEYSPGRESYQAEPEEEAPMSRAPSRRGFKR